MMSFYQIKSTIKNGLPVGKGFQFVKLRIGPSWLRRRCWTWSRWGWRPQPICWRAQWRSTPSLQPEINRKFKLVAKKFKNWITHIQAHFKIDILLLILIHVKPKKNYLTSIKSPTNSIIYKNSPQKHKTIFHLFFSSFSGRRDQHEEGGVRFQEAVGHVINDSFAQLPPGKRIQEKIILNLH